MCISVNGVSDEIPRKTADSQLGREKGLKRLLTVLDVFSTGKKLQLDSKRLPFLHLCPEFPCLSLLPPKIELHG